MMNHPNRVAAALFLALALPQIAVAQTSAAAPVSGASSAVWTQGSKMEAKALSRLSKARTKLAKAERDIASANNKQATAASAGTIAAADFRAITAAVPTFVGSEDAKAWAKKVSDASERWTKADKRGAQGGKELARATKAKKSAEQEIIAAQSDVDRGRAMMGTPTAR
jgi:hypothetical protein